MLRQLFRALIAFITIATVKAATPTLIQHVASGIDVYKVNAITFSMPNPVLSGNCLIMGIQFKSSGSISSITDDKSNTWVAGPTVTNATNSKTLAIYYVLNAVVGTSVINVNFSGFSSSAGFEQACVSEFNNIATSSATDGNSGSSTSKTAGSITTTANGDLIYQYGADLSDTNSVGGAFNGTSITKGSGFTLLNADLQVGTVSQYQVQGTAGAINPAFTTTGAATWGTVALALKSASAGTASGSGIRIVHMQHTLLQSHRLQGRDANIVMQFPSTGNMLVGLYNAALPFVTAVSDSASNTWTVDTNLKKKDAAGVVSSQIVYAANATTNTDLSTVTVTTDIVGTGDMFLILCDVAGAATSPYDTVAVATANQGSFGNITMETITPTTSNGLVFHVDSIDFDAIHTMVSPSPSTSNIFDAWTNNFGHATDVSPIDMDNGYAHAFNANTSSITFTETSCCAGIGIGPWASVAAAFKSPVVPTPAPAPAKSGSFF